MKETFDPNGKNMSTAALILIIGIILFAVWYARNESKSYISPEEICNDSKNYGDCMQYYSEQDDIMTELEAESYDPRF